MKLLKSLLMVLALTVTFSAFAMTDDESVEFTEAVGKGDLKIVKNYVKTYPEAINEKFFAWSPLQMAATKGQFDMVKYLVEKGADKEYVHPITKMNSFHLAAFDGNEAIVNYLAAKGADINVKMKGGISLIRVIKDEGNTKMVDLLLKLGVSEEGCQEECM